MSVAGAVDHGHHAPVAWPLDAQYGTATPGRIGMSISCVSDAFSLGGLLLAYGILRERCHRLAAPPVSQRWA